MIKINAKNKLGFSLAEALITLLVVCLITIASIPILTTKRRSIDNKQANSGKWVCLWDGNNLKSYFYIKGKFLPGGDIVQDQASIDKAKDKYYKTGVFEGAGCKFVPPPNTKNYVITYVGGGGGGAASTIKPNAKIMMPGDIFTVSENAPIIMVAASPGGSGGQTYDFGSEMFGDGHCDERKSTDSYHSNDEICGGSGAPGVMLIAVHEFKKNDKIKADFQNDVTGRYACTNPGISGTFPRNTDISLIRNNNTELLYQLQAGFPGGCANYDGHNSWNYLDENKVYKKISTGSNSGNIIKKVKGNDLKAIGGKFITDNGGKPDYSRKLIKKSSVVTFPAWYTFYDNTLKRYPILVDASNSSFMNSIIRDIYGISLDTFVVTYGYGGRGHRDPNKWGNYEQKNENGGPGTVGLLYYTNISGKSGGAGEVPPSQIAASISSGLWALPGKGGKGEQALSSYTPKDGETTYVDRFKEAQGGKAASLEPYNETFGDVHAVGAIGERAMTYHSNYPIALTSGFYKEENAPENERQTGEGKSAKLYPINNFYPHGAGSGGGGAGAVNYGYNDIFNGIYSGGDGATGAVIIEW